jgi:hypothetical protein
MANTASVSGTLAYVGPSSTVVNSNFGVTSITATGNHVTESISTIGTTDEVVDLVNVVTPGMCLFTNLDATGTITLGSNGVLYDVELKAGESALLRWGGAAIHAVATTASLLKATIIED